MRGICKSSSRMSKSSCCVSCKACTPSPAVITVWPRLPSSRLSSSRFCGTSSAASTRRGGRRTLRRSLAGSAAWRAGNKGSMTWNTLPCGTLASAQMRPCIRVTSCLLMVVPRPVPPKRRVVEASACTKGSKMASRRSAAIPMPLSRTSKCSWPPSRRAARLTPPLAVNLMALSSRLPSTCRMRNSSPCSTAGSCGSYCTSMRKPLLRAWMPYVDASSSTSASRL
ncbi:hypothetical protein D3C81_1450110 [compost metagenome]